MKNVYVKIVADTTKLEAALRRVNQQMKGIGVAFQRVGRNGWRSRLTAGEKHIDRIAKDCIARRDDLTTTARRLMVAADIAAVIDNEERAA